MSRRKSRMDEIGEESRRRILDAAETLFAKKGFARTSFVDIAELSGISRGSIPWHFDNKEGLLVAVVERAIDKFIHAGTITNPGPEGVRELFDRVKEWLHTPAAAMLYTLLSEAMSKDGTIHEHYVQFFANRRKAAANILASAGADQGDESTYHIAAVVNGAIFGLGLQRQLDPGFDLDAAMDWLEKLVENMINNK
ncbi:MULTISPECIES: TetR/AcrR family transcriptional regulator [Thermocrispum]|jgi:TetR/AcrR family acrAB operon transcriptional repressor|uniref:TetR family transcriptional regulator n=1 Tax=Thermocrispum agreste TaxID=37925 RepID=A0A2W4LAD5_9PSEU|nr:MULTISPECIES: TetR/AcrR family transcriptional regulator [Thermocrispum]PZM97999.1 MAG: TetR family transcriptional regulator [Thermocrispum agreste]